MVFNEELLDCIRKARHVVVFTGAGVSAESGIPTFRDAQTGLWTEYDAATLASPEGFRADPALVWGWYEWRRMGVLLAQPNPAHSVIAELANRFPRLTLVTQNVDDLHERAGSYNPIHLHGSLHRPRCFVCARHYDYPSGIPDEPEGGRRLEPPRCTNCGGYIRPGVVWFGESLPEQVFDRHVFYGLACGPIAGNSGPKRRGSRANQPRTNRAGPHVTFQLAWQGRRHPACAVGSPVRNNFRLTGVLPGCF